MDTQSKAEIVLSEVEAFVVALKNRVLACIEATADHAQQIEAFVNAIATIVSPGSSAPVLLEEVLNAAETANKLAVALTANSGAAEIQNSLFSGAAAAHAAAAGATTTAT